MAPSVLKEATSSFNLFAIMLTQNWMTVNVSSKIIGTDSVRNYLVYM